jgi:hypothetical protein
LEYLSSSRKRLVMGKNEVRAGVEKEVEVRAEEEEEEEEVARQVSSEVPSVTTVIERTLRRRKRRIATKTTTTRRKLQDLVGAEALYVLRRATA